MAGARPRTGKTGDDHEPSTEVRTFLIADVRGYTRFTQDRGDEEAARLAGKFASLAEDGVAQRGGEVIEFRGDEALAIFRSPRAALRAAVDLQTRFGKESVEDPTMPLHVGIGLDAGEAVPVAGGYRGGALNLAARLCSAAGPGEILASETVVNLARRVAGIRFVPRGPMPLKGFAEPVEVVQVLFHVGQPLMEAESQMPDSGESHEAESAIPLGGFLGARPEGDLVGRQREIELIEAALQAVQEGAGKTVLISGEAGIGKTRLAQQASIVAWDRRFFVATATCYEQRQAVPYYAAQEALSAAFALAPPSFRRPAQRRWADLATLIRAMRSGDVDGAPENRDELLRAVVEFTRTLSAIRPLALMFDDLQWSDTSSLELFQDLARHTRASAVLLLGTYRDIDVAREDPLSAVLLDLNRQKLVDWLPLKELTAAETAQLAASILHADHVPPDVARFLHDRTEGNPYFTEEILDSLIERGVVFQQDGQWASRPLTDVQVPTRVRAIVDQRLARLSGVDRDVLREASVLGSVLTFDEVQSTTGRPEEEIEDALERAVTSGLLRHAGSDSFTFSNTITRQALYDDLPMRRRRRLHLSAGDALERAAVAAAGSGREPPRPAELAWHFLHAAAPRRALPYAVQAGDAALAVFAFQDAENHYRTALELARTGGSGLDTAQVLEKLAGVLQSVGRYDESHETLERAAQEYDALREPDKYRQAVARAAILESLRGRSKEGLERIQPLLDDARAVLPSRGTVLLHVAESQLLFTSHRYREAADAAQEASNQARDLRDGGLLAEAEVRRAEALGVLGPWDEAQRVFEGVIAVAGTAEKATVIRALGGIGTTCLYAGKFDDARRHHKRALDLAEETKEPRTHAYALATLAVVEQFSGNWRIARDLLASVESVAAEQQVGIWGARSKILLAHLSLLEGRWSEWGPRLEDVLQRSAGSADSWDTDFTVVSLAERDLLEGHYESATELLLPVARNVDEPSWHNGNVLLTLARARLAGGDAGGAETFVESATRLAASGHNHVTLMEALWVRAMVRVAQQRKAEAERLFEASLSLARKAPYPYLEGRILLEWGKLSQNYGDRMSARSYFDSALRIFRRLGARPYVEPTLRALAGAGRS